MDPDDPRSTPAWLRATAVRPAGRQPGCPEEDTIAALAEGALSAADRTAAVAHVAGCASCRATLAAVRRLLADPAVAREGARLDAGRLRRWRLPVGVAAAAALVILLVPLWRGDGRRDTLREPALTTTPAPVPAAPAGTVAAVALLRWSSVPHADLYRVRVYNADGTIVWETEVADTTAAWPAGTTLQPDTPYFWKVEARTDWDRWAASDLIEFRLERRP